VVDVVKRPITLAVLDEVASVLQSGHYTRNIASALRENREEIKEMVAEKIRNDPTASRINFVPFHDRLIEQASETTLRVVLEVLADPRTDELVSDLLRDNITQIRQAVRERGD
jgi:voltage-gated potassium channel